MAQLKQKISFIGFGKMAQSLANGWIHLDEYHFHAAAPSLNKAMTIEGIETTAVNLDIVHDADVIILAVKPTQMKDVCAEIASFIPHGCLLISVAAGLSLSWFTTHLPPKTAVIRAMPNIAARVKQSATPLIKNHHVSQQQALTAQALFNAVGIMTWVEKETDMDIFTALSGSGPAYVFQFIQNMVSAAINMGLDDQTAKAFAIKTVSGAVALALENNIDLQELTRQVTSKGGTTEAALDVLQKHQFSQVIEAAMRSAQNRAQELDYT